MGAEDKAAYTGTNYLLQAEAARRAWIDMHASYPLLPVPDHPGPRPPRWRYFARRRWERLADARNAAKAWNFGALYGANVAQIAKREPVEIIVVDDQTGATLIIRESTITWEQMGRSA